MLLTGPAKPDGMTILLLNGTACTWQSKGIQSHIARIAFFLSLLKFDRD